MGGGSPGSTTNYIYICICICIMYSVFVVRAVVGKKQWWWQPLAPPLTVGQKVQTTTNCSSPRAFYLYFCIFVFLYLWISLLMNVFLALPLTIGQKGKTITNCFWNICISVFFHFHISYFVSCDYGPKPLGLQFWSV